MLVQIVTKILSSKSYKFFFSVCVNNMFEFKSLLKTHLFSECYHFNKLCPTYFCFLNVTVLILCFLIVLDLVFSLLLMFV